MTITVRFPHHLSLVAIQESFEPVDERLEALPGRHDLLVDALHMESYDNDARDYFIKSWGPARRERIRRLAIVTRKTLWRMVGTTLGLATRYEIKVFDTVAEAQTWLKH